MSKAKHHDFRFKWKKQMQNEYPHDISINLFIKLLILLNYGGIFGLRPKYIMWVLILHLFFFQSKRKSLCYALDIFPGLISPKLQCAAKRIYILSISSELCPVEKGWLFSSNWDIYGQNVIE